MYLEATSNHLDQKADDSTDLVLTCAWCNKVKDANGVWGDITDAARAIYKSATAFTHGICDSCYTSVLSSLVH